MENGTELEYIKNILARHLGEVVMTPKGLMCLTELYSNGNVSCVPIGAHIHYYLAKFHASSVKPFETLEDVGEANL